jgi:hypothetical protein
VRLGRTDMTYIMKMERKNIVANETKNTLSIAFYIISYFLEITRGYT